MEMIYHENVARMLMWQKGILVHLSVTCKHICQKHKGLQNDCQEFKIKIQKCTVFCANVINFSYLWQISSFPSFQSEDIGSVQFFLTIPHKVGELLRWQESTLPPHSQSTSALPLVLPAIRKSIALVSK